MKYLLILLLLWVTTYTQDFTHYDNFVYEMDQYGYIEYAIPIDISYDTLISDYTDTIFCWVHLDSIPIDSTIANDFNFYNVTKNIWIAQTTYYKVLYVVDTLRYEVVLLHIISEKSPHWVNIEATSK